MRLIYHPEAEAELVEAARFYEGRASTVGAQFIDAVDRAIDVVQDAPERWRVIEAGIRRYVMPRFPYSIYYRIFPSHLQIVAIKHHSRRPGYWRDRLSE